METFERNIPVYLQVVDLFYTLIVSGELNPGDQIPPVRKLAAEWGVNPNTVQKALQILELEEITIAYVGKGRFVTEDTAKIETIKTKLVNTEIQKFCVKMQQFGLSTEQVIHSLGKYLEQNAIEKGSGEIC